MAEEEPTTGQRVHREIASLGTDSTMRAPAATPELVVRGQPTLELPAGDQVASAGALDPGQIIGHFVIRKRLGEGGMGVVLAGEDPDLGRPVAIKVVKDTHQHPAYRDRLLREAKVMARLEHANIVRVYEVGSDRGRLFVAMELVDGVTLAAWLALERRAWRDILGMFQQVGAGLAAVHRAGLVHRDFKPDNVLVDRNGRARVADFGLARVDPDSAGPALGASLTRTGMRVGTPAYMAPEQHHGGDVDARADQYSFCISLREALIGSRPAKIEDAHWGEVPRAVRAAIMRGASIEVNERWPAMEVLLDALSRGAGRRRVRFGLAAAALAVAGGGIALAAMPEDEAAPAPPVVVMQHAPRPTSEPSPVQPAPVRPVPTPTAPPMSPVETPPKAPAKAPPMSPAETRETAVVAKRPVKQPVGGETQVGEIAITPQAPIAETAEAKQHNAVGARHEMIAAHRGAVRAALRDFGFLGLTLVGDDREADLRELEGRLAGATDDLQRGVIRYAMGQGERARDNCIGAIRHWADAKKLVHAGTKDLEITEPRRAQAFLFLGRAQVGEAYCMLLGGQAMGVGSKLQNALGSMWLAKDPERAELFLAWGIAEYESGDADHGKELLREAARKTRSEKLREAIVVYARAVGLVL